jgi:two-component system response regulator PilR (NtrC family)
MESELFGYHKGSFTGATGDKAGLFQAAEGGTLFLDEVADLPLPMQVKLLRAIQEKAVRPLGAPAEVPVDVRIISATHKDLGGMVERGEFRQDLFYRINVIELPLPPLHGRRDDIPLLVEHFLTRIARQSGAPKPRLEPAALQRLMNYEFPGNVRELENILERAVALCDPGLIRVADLQLPNRAPKTAPPAPEAPTVVPEVKPLEDYLGDIEKQAILKALEETHWNRTAAARKLGMSLRSLRYRLSKLGLD